MWRTHGCGSTPVVHPRTGAPPPPDVERDGRVGWGAPADRAQPFGGSSQIASSNRSPRIRSAADAERLTPFDAGEVLLPILEQIRLLVTRLTVPVIGFVGAPFTMVSYLIDGPGPRNVDEAKAFMWSQPRAWERIMTFSADHLADFGVAQYEAGAPVLQVFDSWFGSLAPRDYERHVLPATHRLLERLREAGVPTVHYAGGNPALLPLVADAGGDVI